MFATLPASDAPAEDRDTMRKGNKRQNAQHPDRQKGPHAHAINFDPSGRLVFVCDLGADKVFAYNFDAATGKLSPATPASIASVIAQQPSVTVSLTGTSVNGSGFFDPGANLPAPARAFNHISATCTAGSATGEGSRVLEVHRMSIPLDTDLVGVLVVANDVTEARRMQSQLYQASRMQAIGQLAGGGRVHDRSESLVLIERGLELEVGRLGEPVRDEDNRGGGSDDIGDVSWVVPTITLNYPANIPGLPGHAWQNAIAMATPALATSTRWLTPLIWPCNTSICD